MVGSPPLNTSNSRAIVFGISVNGTVPDPRYEFKGTLKSTDPPASAQEEQLCVGHGLISLTASDTVTLRNRTEAGGNDVTLTSPAPDSGDFTTNAVLTLKKIA